MTTFIESTLEEAVCECLISPGYALAFGPQYAFDKSTVETDTLLSDLRVKDMEEMA